MEDLKKTVWDYYLANKRSMPWRETNDPYKILISEVMLQQTQVGRVIPKYSAFIARFPTARALADANFTEVLRFWSGLGYNRRAQYLHQSAKIITKRWSSQIPEDIKILQELPGVGYNTAAAVMVYAFKKPVVFIETNIRTVFIHHFFAKQSNVADREILPFVEKSLDTKRPDEWYWALMDYGAYLKRTVPNPSRKSLHHTKQSKFEGSRRQIRGKIMKILLQGPTDKVRLIHELSDERTEAVISELIDEKLVRGRDGRIELTD